MADDNASVTIKIPGRRIEQPALPRVLQTRVRAAGPVIDDPFLPADYVRPRVAVDLSATARSTEGGAEEKAVAAQPGQVIALELADGVVIFTSPENLKETLARVAPQAIDADGGVHLEELTQRGVATRSVIGEAAANLIVRVTTLDVGAASDAIIESARRKVLEWLRESGQDKLVEYAELGVSWLGTKALMWAIESRLPRAAGLYRWGTALGEPTSPLAAGDKRLEDAARQGSLLVFIHGTGSSADGSFLELQSASREYWQPFETRFGERVYAFEHRTLSESPIENALQLALALPQGARLNLVTHSRGGLVGDLLCLDRLDAADRALVDAYAVDDVALGEVEGAERERLRQELERAYGEQRAQLRELAATLRGKQFVIERYVRVASPARGTRLASGNFDVFLSGVLSLIGLVPALAASPLYSAFKRVVLEVAKNRTRPNLVPGIEAMLPESPMARLLARAAPQEATAMAVVAGDIEGGGLLKRLGVLFTDHAFFDGTNNDLVVDTDSMYAGVARPGKARAMFDQGPDVSHFRYFTNEVTRTALRDWLVDPNVALIEAFRPLPGLGGELTGAEQKLRDEARRRTRGLEAASLPAVVVLPGIMGSHLWRNRKDRVWFDFDDLVAGGLEKVRFGEKSIEAEKLFDMFYGDLCDHLDASHRVERFAYDWRLPLDELADALALRLRTLLDETREPQRPVRVLAHSMGGLVVRALIHKHRDVWEELIKRAGARYVMLGTPNQGSHLMVETLIGKSGTIRSLGRMDLKHELQGVLDIVASFPGALQLLPRPGFADTGGDQKGDYFKTEVWKEFKREIRDFWFGDGVVAAPTEDALKAGRWLWDRDGAAPALPLEHKDKVFYVRGCATSTPCGITKDGDRWKMLGTPYGDGSVTWDSGKIEGIGTTLYMPAEHGALADTKEYFDSLAGLLARGDVGELMTSAPATRGGEAAEPVPYEAGPPVYPTAIDLASGLVGRRPRVRARVRAQAALKVRVCAMDLRGVSRPLLLGHYEQDPISGAEAVVDRELVNGALTIRYNLGLYAGPLGTATVVLTAPNEMERLRGSRRGAVVAGLGQYDGSLGVATLTEAVRTAALRYLLHVVDTGDETAVDDSDAGASLASLLVGYNSSANLTIGDALTALLRGVIEANRKFGESSRSKVRINDLQIVEMYVDTAISAAYALQRVAKALNDAPNAVCQIVAAPLLQQGEGMRPRLEDARAASYWPRIVVTDADRSEDDCPPERQQVDVAELRRLLSLGPRASGETSVEQPQADADRAATNSAPQRRRVAFAERLRFLYLGQRARAETKVEQRQPGLVESLVAQQLHVRSYQPDFSRTLFQLLVPLDFKDAARGLDRVVLVLDGYTANLPWELMLADDVPLAAKTAVVRQLSSTRFRPRVHQAVERRALVVGNPSSQGFAAAFLKAKKDPDRLPSAENEANTVAEVLAQYRYEVIPAIGEDQQAIDIFNKLYRHPYRVLHIAAHGVYDEPHIDGSPRSGVVLSGGLLLTAVEIGAMEVVPDLVFLNCCHLGKVDRAPAEFNRLAYSVARELIEMGVRAVVVAGWAVDDDAASLFAETFYRSLLGDTKPFGDAVFIARRAVWEQFGNSITWGAYQAYGDPGWRLQPRRDDYDAPSETGAGWRPVAVEELISRIDQIRVEVGRAERTLTATERKKCARDVETLLRKLPEAKWLLRLDVCTALGRIYGDLGKDYFGTAIEYLTTAVQKHDKPGRAPIVAIEQLANFEVRDGEARGKPELIRCGIARLMQLNRVAAACGAADPVPEEVNSERAALLGSAYKRLATVYARACLDPRKDAQEKEDAARQMNEALIESERWYRGPVKDLATEKPDFYNGLNWLLIAGLRRRDKEAGARIEFAHKCAASALASFREDPTFWYAIAVADAALAEALIANSFLKPGAAAECVDQLAQKYRAAMQGIQVKPKELDSTVTQICLLALLYGARAAAGEPDAEIISKSLRLLADQLLPGACGSDWEGDLVPAAAAGAAPTSGPAPTSTGAVAPARGGARSRKTSARKPRKRKT